MSERIPIGPGFYIAFSKDGRAVSRGLDDSSALPSVQHWLANNQDHKDRVRVEHWIRLKQEQIQQDVEQNRLRLKREELSAKVDNAARKSGLRDPELTVLIKEVTLNRHGLDFED